MLDALHHVIFIVDRLQEMTVAGACEPSFVHKRRLFVFLLLFFFKKISPTWDPSLAAATAAVGGDTEAWALPARSSWRVWMCVSSPGRGGWMGGGDAAGRKL